VPGLTHLQTTAGQQATRFKSYGSSCSSSCSSSSSSDGRPQLPHITSQASGQWLLPACNTTISHIDYSAYNKSCLQTTATNQRELRAATAAVQIQHIPAANTRGYACWHLGLKKRLYNASIPCHRLNCNPFKVLPLTNGLHTSAV
jgi:hypothetical protein